MVNDASIPIIEVNNKAGFGSGDVNVLTYAGADDVEFGRLQGKLVDQAFGGKKAKVAYVMGFAGRRRRSYARKGGMSSAPSTRIRGGRPLDRRF